MNIEINENNEFQALKKAIEYYIDCINTIEKFKGQYVALKGILKKIERSKTMLDIIRKNEGKEFDVGRLHFKIIQGKLKIRVENEFISISKTILSDKELDRIEEELSKLKGNDQTIK